jgi:organic radical activating enzyme
MDSFIISITNQDQQGLLHSHRLNLPVESSILTKDEIIHAINDIKEITSKIRKVIIMGGEPFDWHHQGWTVSDVIINFTKAGFPVEVVTNGNFFLNSKDTVKFIEKISSECKKEVTINVSSDIWHANYNFDDNICYPIDNLIRTIKNYLDFSFKIKIKASWITGRDSKFNMPDKFKSFYRKFNVIINEKPLVISDENHHLYPMTPILQPGSLCKDKLGKQIHNLICDKMTGGITDSDKKVFMLMSNEKIFNNCSYHRYLCANGTYWACYDGEGIPDFKIGQLGAVSSKDIDNHDSVCPFFGIVRRKGVSKVLEIFLDNHPQDRCIISEILNSNYPLSICGIFGCSLCKALAKKQLLNPIGQEVARITGFKS